MYAYCSQTTNGSSANNSTINWTIYTKEGGSTCYDTGPTYLWIGGVQRYYKARTSWSSFAFPAAAGSTSGSYTLAHNNDGSVAAQEVTLKSAIYTGEWNSTTRTGTWTLDKIARFFSSTPAVSLASRTEKTMVLNWSTSETCSSITWYGHKNGASVTISGVPGTSGTITIDGLDAGTTYTMYGTFRRSDSSQDSNSGSAGYTTHSYPSVSSVATSELTIGNGQTVYLNNPLGRSVTVKMYKSDGTLLYTAPATTGTSVTFTPTAATLYDSIKTVQSANCYYSAVCSNPASTSNTGSGYTYKISGSETPTINVDKIYTYDATTAVTNVTGQTGAGGWLVQGMSELRVAITEAASPKNGASISKYEVTFAGVTQQFSVDTTGKKWGVFNGTGNQSIAIKITDTRNLSTTVYKTVNYVAYRAPSISLTAGRANNYGETVNISAAYTGSDVNGKNGVKVQWSGAGKSGYLTGSASDYDAAETGTKSTTATGINNETAYPFSATITDKFGKTATSNVLVPVGQPTMFVDVEQAGVGINTLPRGQGLYVEDGAYIGYDGGKRLMQRYKMDLTDFSADNFYPAVFEITTDMITCEIHSPALGWEAPYNQNAITFSVKHQGSSDTPRSFNIYHYGTYNDEVNEICIGCIGGGNSYGNVCVWLRGGINYSVYSNTPIKLYENGYSSKDNAEIYTVGGNYYGGTNTNVSIYFTPKSTIAHGMYTSRGFTASGNIHAAGNLSAGGNVTGGFIKASGNTEAGADIVARNGYLYSFYSGKSLRMGCENSSHAHYVTDAADSHWFNKAVRVAGALYKGSGYNVNVPGIYVQSTQPGATQTGDIWVI
jgi:hypothetical protein